jgi:hypothetical protein
MADGDEQAPHLEDELHESLTITRDLLRDLDNVPDGESNSAHAIALLTLAIGKLETLARGLEQTEQDHPDVGGIFPA